VRSLRPTPRVRRITRLSISAALFVGGPVSLLVSPLPARLVLAYALVGAVTGVLYLIGEEFWAFLGIGVYLFGVELITEAAQRRTPDLQIPSWQPVIVAASVWIGVQLLSPSARRYVLGKSDGRKLGDWPYER
jgi:hypothetical protein